MKHCKMSLSILYFTSATDLLTTATAPDAIISDGVNTAK